MKVVAIAVMALAIPGSAWAADMPRKVLVAPPESFLPESAFFGGLGGSYNSVGFVNQSTYGKGTSFTPPTGLQAAIIGSAAGSTDVNLETQSTLAPSIQAGYFQHFAYSRWMWGGKFSYSYLARSSSSSDQLIPQAGGFSQGGVFTPFTGNYVVQSYRQTAIQQMSFMPFVGRSFDRSYVYLGAGPTLTQTKTSIDNITGFANINGVTTAITGLGNGAYYSTRQWVWGGGAVVGATYFFDSTWFVDFSYTYSMTGNKTSDWGGPWSDTPLLGATRTGTNTGTSSGNVVTQAFTVTINKALVAGFR
jgi:hypothetical protein